MWPRTNQKTLQSNKEQLNQCWIREFHCAMTERITKRQRARKRENTTDQRGNLENNIQSSDGWETVCSSLRGTIPAGAPPCSSWGLTGTGFLHPDPALLAVAGLAVIEKTDDGGQQNGNGPWTFSQTTQFYWFSLWSQAFRDPWESHSTGLKERSGC